VLCRWYEQFQRLEEQSEMEPGSTRNLSVPVIMIETCSEPGDLAREIRDESGRNSPQSCDPAGHEDESAEKDTNCSTTSNHPSLPVTYTSECEISVESSVQSISQPSEDSIREDANSKNNGVFYV
jgi:hypothetical protein